MPKKISLYILAPTFAILAVYFGYNNQSGIALSMLICFISWMFCGSSASINEAWEEIWQDQGKSERGEIIKSAIEWSKYVGFSEDMHIMYAKGWGNKPITDKITLDEFRDRLSKSIVIIKKDIAE